MSANAASRLRRVLAAAISAVCVFGLAAAPARAAEDVELMTNTKLFARPGERVTVQVMAGDPVHQCELRMLRGSREVGVAWPVRVTKQNVTWSWVVPKKAAALTWRLQVACATYNPAAERQVLELSLKVRGRGGKLRRPAARWPRGTNTGSGLRPDGWDAGLNHEPADGSSGSNGGRRGWVPPIPGRPGNGWYPEGECVYWADIKRPDITAGSGGMNAGEWAKWAREHGFPVDKTPQAGDVAVWESRYEGDNGHVAYVERVDENGVYVSEMNVNGNRGVSESYLSESLQRQAVFIHRKP